jgi:hypothetical protein
MSGPLPAARAPNGQMFDSGDEMYGDAHHANEADDGCKRQGFAGQTDHVKNSDQHGCPFVLVHGMFQSQATSLRGLWAGPLVEWAQAAAINRMGTDEAVPIVKTNAVLRPHHGREPG